MDISNIIKLLVYPRDAQAIPTISIQPTICLNVRDETKTSYKLFTSQAKDIIHDDKHCDIYVFLLFN